MDMTSEKFHLNYKYVLSDHLKYIPGRHPFERGYVSLLIRLFYITYFSPFHVRSIG